MTCLFQCYKTHLNDRHMSFYVKMPSGKRRVLPWGDDEDTARKRVVKATEIDTCNSFPEEIISPAFDPNRVLLRRVIFIGPEKKKYISVGFYPTRNYQPLVELGVPEKIPIILTDNHMRFLVEHLPRQITGLCTNVYYPCSDVNEEGLRMNSTGSFRDAREYLGKQFMSFKLNELRHLPYILFIVINRLTHYTEEMPDMKNYVTAALYSDTYILTLTKLFFTTNCLTNSNLYCESL